MLRTVSFIISVVLLSAAGCTTEDPASTPDPAKKAVNLSQAPVPALQLPELKKPTPLPAERIVHLLYTSNVAGEAEPCG
jgi:hypothetical protein